MSGGSRVQTLLDNEIDFIFAKCSFGSECERAKVNLAGAPKRGWKPLYNDPLIEIKPP